MTKDIRNKIYNIINPDNSGNIWSRAYNWVMLLAIAIGLFPMMFRKQTTLFTWFDIASCFCFIVDYILRWLTADYIRGKKGWKAFAFYPFTFMAIIDLLSILPTLSLLSPAFKIFRVSRVFKILRVIKFIRYYEPLVIIIAVIKKQRKILLMRYYSEEKADNEVDRAALRKGNNEIHKCLGYLTEFVYDKVAIKRKRAIDDMQRFCLEGVRTDKDWKEVNEDLKDELYYYFNSKFARHGYQILSGEPFSLLDEYSSLKENDLNGAYNILFKYLRVVDADVVSDSGSPIDSIRHLYGAIRLITHRSFKEINPCMYLLNVYCLLFLKPWHNEALLKELQDNFTNGYNGFRKLDKQYEHFIDNIEKFYKEIVGKGRNAATRQQLRTLRLWQKTLELEHHAKWLNDFAQQYSK